MQSVAIKCSHKFLLKPAHAVITLDLGIGYQVTSRLQELFYWLLSIGDGDCLNGDTKSGIQLRDDANVNTPYKPRVMF